MWTMKQNEPLSRRAVLSGIAAGPALLAETAAAQTQTAATPIPPTASESSVSDKALSDLRRASATLSKLAVPMDLEPAFVFRP